MLEGCRGRPFAFERHMSGVVQLTPELTKALEHRIEALPTKRVNAKQRRTASVFVPLIHNTRQTQGNKVIQELSVLFTVRTNNVSTHKGQVSFPGGHIDQTETPEEAATREFIEEVSRELFYLAHGASFFQLLSNALFRYIIFPKSP